MPFPNTLVIDDFNRANAETLGANYTEGIDSTGLTGFDISGNTAVPDVAAQCQTYYNVQNYGPDCEVHALIGVEQSAGAGWSLYVRLVNEGTANVDGYSVSWVTDAGTDIIRIYRLDNEVHTQLGADILQEYSAGDRIGMRVTGSTLEPWIRVGDTGNGTSLGTRTDSTYSAAGKLGIVHYSDGSGSLNDFGGGTLNGDVTIHQAIYRGEEQCWYR